MFFLLRGVKYTKMEHGTHNMEWHVMWRVYFHSLSNSFYFRKIDITFCCCKVSKIETFSFLTIRFRNKIHCRCRSFYQETPSKGLNSTICFHFALFSIDILLKTATCYVIVLETHKKPLMFSVQTVQVFCRKKEAAQAQLYRNILFSLIL